MRYPSDECRVCMVERKTLSVAAAYMSGVIAQRMAEQGLPIPLCEKHRASLERSYALVVTVMRILDE